MDTPPLVVALERARESRYTGALVLRRPGGEAYTITLQAGVPVQVEPGPDEIREGATRLMADRIRQAVLEEELPVDGVDDAAARLKLASRRLARILRLSGDCHLEPARHVPPATGGPSEPPRASVLLRAPLPPTIPRDDATPPRAPSSIPRLDPTASSAPSIRPRVPRDDAPSSQPRAATRPPVPRDDAASSPPPASLRQAIPRDDAVSSPPPGSPRPSVPRDDAVSSPPPGSPRPSMPRGDVVSVPPPSILPLIPRDPPTKTPAPSVTGTRDDSSKPPPSMRQRIAVPAPDEPSAATYAGPRVSIPENAPLRSRTPPPPGLRTPPPPSLRAPPPKTPLPASIRPGSSPPESGRKSSELRRVALPPSIPPPAAASATPTTSAALIRQTVIARVAQLDFSGAERILRERRVADAHDPEIDALAIWVRANLQSDLEGPLASLNLLLHANPKCEHALFYRGLVLKKSGQRKAALRDFVTVAKQNPRHGAALFEIKELRSFSDD